MKSKDFILGLSDGLKMAGNGYAARRAVASTAMEIPLGGNKPRFTIDEYWCGILHGIRQFYRNGKC